MIIKGKKKEENNKKKNCSKIRKNSFHIQKYLISKK